MQGICVQVSIQYEQTFFAGTAFIITFDLVESWWACAFSVEVLGDNLAHLTFVVETAIVIIIPRSWSGL